jgi:3-methyladenine DNA glycosylase/8-oxoguanine DNA glycosylase
MSNRKAATLRALAERFVDGELSDEALARMTDDEIEAELTDVPGIGPWTRAWLSDRRTRPARRTALWGSRAAPGRAARLQI